MFTISRALRAATVLLTFAAAPLAAQTALKISYVDTRKIMEQAPGRVEAQRLPE